MSPGFDNPSTVQAAVLIDELVAGGVTDVVLAPGSRSAPLAFALHEADAAGRLRLHVRIDERGAGFLALGLAKATGRPAVVVTTSGTAVANLHPAVLEAHHGGVPLVVLSADRPPHLRGVGANQVIDQMTVFGGDTLRYRHEIAVAGAASREAYVRGQVCRAVAAARGAFTSGRPGPAQLNVPFDVPLVPDSQPEHATAEHPSPGHATTASLTTEPGMTTGPRRSPARTGAWTNIVPWESASAGSGSPAGSGDRPADADPGDVPLGGRYPGGASGADAAEKVLVVADLESGAVAAEIAASGRLVISEAGGLGGAAVLAAGMHLLEQDAFVAAHRPDRVVVLGRPTLFRSVGALLARGDVTVDVIDHPARYADVAGTVRTVRTPASFEDDAVSGVDCHIRDRLVRDSASGGAGTGTNGNAAAWRAAWRRADSAASRAVAGVLGRYDLATSAVLARSVGRALPSGATLLVGSSQPPRDLARFAEARGDVRVLANRGVAGIDGTVSTAIGVALACKAGAGLGGLPVVPDCRTYALMGDLTFVHDVTALAIGPHEPRPDLTIVVANNDGGGIFATLEQGAPPFASSFERIFGTPTGVQIAQLADAFGVPHVLATTVDQLVAEVSEPPHGLRIVEVPVTRTDLRSFAEEVATAVHRAIIE